jgi:hypothetical protein
MAVTKSSIFLPDIIMIIGTQIFRLSSLSIKRLLLPSLLRLSSEGFLLFGIPSSTLWVLRFNGIERHNREQDSVD